VLLIAFSLFVTGWHRSTNTPADATATESTASTTTAAPATSCDSVSIVVAPTTTTVEPRTGGSDASPPAVSATVAVASVARRQAQNAYAYGFRPGETVNASLPASGCDLGATFADASGSVAFAWTVGSEELLGDHEFVVTGESGTATAPFRVIIDEPVTTGGVGQPLFVPVIAVLGVGAVIFVLALRWMRVKLDLEGRASQPPA
jgi:hypothetical protein